MEKSTRGTVRFALREKRLDAHKRAPIEITYQLGGKKRYRYTLQNAKLRKENWDSTVKKAPKAIYLDKSHVKTFMKGVDFAYMPTVKDVADINAAMANVITEISDIERSLKDKLSFDNVIAELKKDKKPSIAKTAVSNNFYDFIDLYIENNKATRKPGSLTVYKSLKKHLKEFQHTTGTKVTFDNTNHDFFEQFKNYLVTETKLMNVTINKQLSTAKTFLNYARKKGVVVNQGYKDYSIKAEELEVTALTMAEFEKFYNHDFSGNKRLDEQRDVFCFSCATGMRYSDLKQLSSTHLKEDAIYISMIKKNQPITLRIPYNQYSTAILAKYKKDKRPLPVISNQKMNKALKEVAEKVELNEEIEIVRFKGANRIPVKMAKHKKISCHVGRKAFVTICLERGMTAEQIMPISGHTDRKSFERYVAKNQSLQEAVFQKSWAAKKENV